MTYYNSASQADEVSRPTETMDEQIQKAAARTVPNRKTVTTPSKSRASKMPKLIPGWVKRGR